jgi:hypothetical protein
VVAVQSVSVADAGQGVGFDLDGLCTCPDPESCRGSAQHCDGPGGRDNKGNAALLLVDQYFALAPKIGDVNTRIAKGKLTYLFQIDQYNGGPNDPSVAVSAYVSTGLVIDGFGNVTTPKWDGNDAWAVDPDTTLGSRMLDDGGYAYQAQYITALAYVTNGTLVAPLTHYPLGIGVGRLDVTDFALVATISPEHRVEGQLVGRVATKGALELLAALTAPPDGGCDQGAGYKTLHDELCQTADIMSDPARDRTNAACNALSIAIPFVALPAKLGAPFAASPVRFCEGGVEDCAP